MDVTSPQVLLNGEELQNIDKHVTPEELCDPFAPTAAMRGRIACVHNTVHD